jgi:CBS domain-containing protein
MTLAVFTVKPTTSVKDVARLFIERRISGVPVVDDQGKIVGIVSEGDLVHRSEISTQRRRPSCIAPRYRLNGGVHGG